MLLDKFKSKTKLRALARLFKRIYIEKPKIVSSITLDVCIPHKSHYSSYYLKLDIEGGEYMIFNDKNLNLLK